MLYDLHVRRDIFTHEQCLLIAVVGECQTFPGSRMILLRGEPSRLTHRKLPKQKRDAASEFK